jgi:hypothetical protein
MYEHFLSRQAWRRKRNSGAASDRRISLQVGPARSCTDSALHAIGNANNTGAKHDHTLQPTALVNEVYLLLVDQSGVGISSLANTGMAAKKPPFSSW